MSQQNKDVLLRANAAIERGDHEAFLANCTDDVEWIFVGDQHLKGKDAVRRYINATYLEPPRFTVSQLVAEGDTVIAIGDITLKDEAGKSTHYAYCDVWRVRDGKLAALTAYVVKTQTR